MRLSIDQHLKIKAARCQTNLKLGQNNCRDQSRLACLLERFSEALDKVAFSSTSSSEGRVAANLVEALVNPAWARTVVRI